MFACETLFEFDFIKSYNTQPFLFTLCCTFLYHFRITAGNAHHLKISFKSRNGVFYNQPTSYSAEMFLLWRIVVCAVAVNSMELECQDRK